MIARTSPLYMQGNSEKYNFYEKIFHIVFQTGIFGEEGIHVLF